jgi:hypothetical protein
LSILIVVREEVESLLQDPLRRFMLSQPTLPRAYSVPSTSASSSSSTTSSVSLISSSVATPDSQSSVVPSPSAHSSTSQVGPLPLVKDSALSWFAVTLQEQHSLRDFEDARFAL